MKLTGKRGNPVRSFTCRVRKGLAKAQTRIFKGYPLFTGWNVARLLALGVLMSIGTAMYFSMASEGGASAPTTAGRDADARSVNSVPSYLRPLNNDDEGRYGPPQVDIFQVDREATGSGATQTSCHLEVLVRRTFPIFPRGDDSMWTRVYLEIDGNHCTSGEFQAALGHFLPGDLVVGWGSGSPPRMGEETAPVADPGQPYPLAREMFFESCRPEDAGDIGQC